MKKTIFFILALILLFNHLSAMEDKNQKPNKKSHKHLLIDKSLKDFLLTEIIEKKLLDLESLNSTNLPTELKDSLISEIGMQNPCIIIKHLSDYWCKDQKDKTLNFFHALNAYARKRVLKRMMKLILVDEGHVKIYFNGRETERFSELQNLMHLLEYIISTVTLLNEQFEPEINQGFENIKNALIAKRTEQITDIANDLNENQKSRLLEFFIYQPLTESFFDYAFRIVFQNFNNTAFEDAFSQAIKSNILRISQNVGSLLESDLLDYCAQVCPRGLQAIFDYSHQICKVYSRLNLLFCLYQKILSKFSREICDNLSIDDENIFKNAQTKYLEFIAYLHDLSAKRELDINMDNETLRLFRLLIDQEVNGPRDLFPTPWNQQITIEDEINAAKVIGKLIRYIKNSNLISTDCVEKLIRLCSSKLCIRKSEQRFFQPKELEPLIEDIVYKNLAESENHLK